MYTFVYFYYLPLLWGSGRWVYTEIIDKANPGAHRYEPIYSLMVTRTGGEWGDSTPQILSYSTGINSIYSSPFPHLQPLLYSVVLATLDAGERLSKEKEKKEARPKSEHAKPKSEKAKYPVRMRIELKLSEKHLFSSFFFSLIFFLRFGQGRQTGWRRCWLLPCELKIGFRGRDTGGLKTTFFPGHLLNLNLKHTQPVNLPVIKLKRSLLSVMLG